MRVLRHRAAPGVQHRREADLYTQPLWIGRDRQQRVGARLEQEVVDDGLVLVGDGADARRQREHDVDSPPFCKCFFVHLARLTSLDHKDVSRLSGLTGPPTPPSVASMISTKAKA